MFAGLPKVANPGAILFVYGPFKFASKHTSLSNREFDQNLRSRGVGSAIRDFEKVDDLAIAAGFDLVTQHHMPANNMSLVWRFSG